MHLPAPLRAAVGLVATAADQARHLPDRAIELPMLAVSTALQASLRMQQRYAGLAARGDDVLNHRTPSAAPPEWATFDDPVPVEQLRRAVFDQADGGPAVSALTELFGTSDPRVPVPAADGAITDDPAERSDDTADEAGSPGRPDDATGPGGDPTDPVEPGRTGDAKAAKGSKTKPRDAKARASKGAVSKTTAANGASAKAGTSKTAKTTAKTKKATSKTARAKGDTPKTATSKTATSKTARTKGDTPKTATSTAPTPKDAVTPDGAAKRPPAKKAAKPVRPPTGRPPSAFDLAGDD